MAKFQMNKLVRDAIPGKMREENQAPIYRVLSGREFEASLLEKLKEEANEALAAVENEDEYLAELADVKEILDKLLQLRNLPQARLDDAQAQKRTKRGGFDSAYFIETITLDDSSEWAQYYYDRPLQYQEFVAADDDPERRLTPPTIETGLYRHYEGSYYEVLGVGCQTETHEYYVVYRSLYVKEASSEIWVRPYDMFVGTAEKNGQQVQRFSKV